MRRSLSIQLIVILVLLTELLFWSIALSVRVYVTGSEKVFRFQHEEFLYLLFALPVLSGFYILFFSWRKKALDKMGDRATLNEIGASYSGIKSFLKYFLFRNALAFLIIGLANPQYGTSKQEMALSGVDIVLAIDISNSMMAADMAGKVERLKIAKLSVEKLLTKMTGNRIGLVVFAGEAVTQVPVTPDLSSVQLYLDMLSPDILSAQGTAIGAAIERSLETFNFEEGTKKAVIIITDGENHEDNALAAAEKAQEKGVLVHTVGMGSPEGSVIEIYENGQPRIMRDENGEPVITRLNENMLREIATTGGGRYIRAQGTNLGLEELITELEKMDKTVFRGELMNDYNDQYQWMIAISFLLFIIELSIIEDRSLWLEKIFS